MSRNRKIIIAVIVLLLIAVGLLLWLRLRGVPAPEPTVTETTDDLAKPLGGLATGGDKTPPASPPETTPTPDQPVAPVQPPAPPDEQTNLKRIAAAFAERYGSYSNISRFQNLLDLMPYMTPDYATASEQYVLAERAKTAATTVYSGTTTRSLSAVVDAINTRRGNALVIVKTQRQSLAADGTGDVYYQDLKLFFLKEGDLWKVNSADWIPL
ncbi:hypothetical protein A3C96_01930 [Candidatus Uhrbacteria bacterium RIFCSPHIGHO2_02_FULL_60_10]|uniref:Uncharacterized protein n=1 Tax=Candidatus Uhrbacteria bacterium RIFCSPHIGHO2_02_FULL_60_10 TaxID=1802392 RepID=A0A1F7U5M0_9BACT|nr:MAG: hypothetical protein A3C96_01930 [Candidatus Uhrbacteria bacterium RIFCSPHIGHO2_02_FULL_60_10]